MKSIFDYKQSDLEDMLVQMGAKKFNARQIYEWIYKKRIFNFSQMTNLSRSLQEQLQTEFSLDLLTIKRVNRSELTNKYLFLLNDGNMIEAVLMRHDYGNSVCVSSQVGCNMGCTFCESGRLKKVRDLTSGEMVRQIIMIENDIQERIDSVVIMGIGEPFDNYENIMNFIRIINNPYGLEIGARHITVSTSGIVPKIDAYADEDLQTNLAISLHAPNDELRSKIMPINKAYHISELIAAIKRYIAKTNRRVTIEYVMLNNVNDSIKEALELANLLKGLNVYVNLIPYNETSHIAYEKSPKSHIDAFYNKLKELNINVTIRKEFGGNIDAACGQLRASEVEK